MGNKLFVGNLPFSFNEQSLKDLFSEVGTVSSAKVITDRDTGRSKGFGFVEMSSDQEAADCVSKLNGRECDGRALTVSEAKPQSPKGGGGGFGGRSRGGGGGGGGFGRSRY